MFYTASYRVIASSRRPPASMIAVLANARHQPAQARVTCGARRSLIGLIEGLGGRSK